MSINKTEIETIVREIYAKDNAKVASTDFEKYVQEKTGQISVIIRQQVINEQQEIARQIVEILLDEKPGETNLSEKVAESLLNSDLVKNILKEQENEEAKKIMPLFIQALYGVVIGVGSLQFLGSIKELNFYNALPDTNRIPGSPDGNISAWELLFRFIFLAFTILIIAHDWYTYHNKKKIEPVHKFWSYMPQLGSLFFLGQMIHSASLNEMLPWYFWGVFYTLFNILHSQQIIDGPKKIKGVYFAHFAICGVAIILFLCLRKNHHCLWIAQQVILLITILSVLLLWDCLEKPEKKSPTDNTLVTKQSENIWGRKLWWFIAIVILIGLVIMPFIFQPPLYRDNSPALTRSDLKYYADSSINVINESIDNQHFVFPTDTTNEKLYRSLTKISRQIEALGNLPRPAIPHNLFEAINRRLDSFRSAQDSLFTRHNEIVTNQYAHMGKRFDTAGNNFKKIVDESDTMAAHLQTAYMGDVDSVLSEIKTNLGKLRRRLQMKLEKKSVITFRDIDQLQNRIDSIRNVFRANRYRN